MQSSGVSPLASSHLRQDLPFLAVKKVKACIESARKEESGNMVRLGRDEKGDCGRA